MIKFELVLMLLVLTVMATCLCRNSLRLSGSLRRSRVLFPLYDLRRDIDRILMDYILEEPNSVSRAEFMLLSRLSKNVSKIIDVHYDKQKTPLFNMRKTAERLKAYRKTTKVAGEIPEYLHIQNFYKRLVPLSARTTITYTPLIRWEFGLQLMATAFRVKHHAGKKERARRVAEYVVSNSKKVRNDARHHGLVEGSVAA